MDVLTPFKLPFIGMKEGKHKFQYQVDQFFFEAFPDAIIKECQFDVSVDFVKEDTFSQMELQFDGSFSSNCDRCLATINIPISGSGSILFKYGEEESTETDLVYIRRDAPEIDISPFIYEYITLSVPLIKVYNCESEVKPPCDSNMLKHIEDQKTISVDNPLAEQLKGLKLD